MEKNIYFDEIERINIEVNILKNRQTLPRKLFITNYSNLLIFDSELNQKYLQLYNEDDLISLVPYILRTYNFVKEIILHTKVFKESHYNILFKEYLKDDSKYHEKLNSLLPLIENLDLRFMVSEYINDYYGQLSLRNFLNLKVNKGKVLTKNKK